MANIVLKDINKIYPNNVHAVYDFNIEIEDKEFIVFVGPSGCGKSTTLRMIAGLEEITTGEFSIDGKLMNFIPPKDRNVSMVFQNYALYPHMTVYKNMAYGLTIKRDYFPVYKKDLLIDELVKKIKTNKARLNNVLKRMAKDADNNDLKNEYKSIYKEISDDLAKVMEKRKPILGLDSRRIKRLEKAIIANKNEIDFVNGLIDKELKEQTNDEELISMYRNDVKNFTNILNDEEAELNKIKEGNSEILKYRHLYRYEIDYEVFHAADILDLQPYLSRLPNALSGGQRQRVALGRAIVRKPKVFLMDEPLSNLDAKLRVQTRGEISKLHKRIGATTIYVTHDQTEAMTLADRIVIMKDGYIQQVAKPMDAFNDPNNMFVAGFIGSPSMNFIKGKLDKNIFKSNSGNIEIKLNKEQLSILSNYKDKEFTLGIRPEHIYVVDGGDVILNVETIELLGSEFVLYTKTDDQLVTVKTTNPISPAFTGPIKLKFDQEKLYFFDSETTNRIR